MLFQLLLVFNSFRSIKIKLLYRDSLSNYFSLDLMFLIFAYMQHLDWRKMEMYEQKEWISIDTMRCISLKTLTITQMSYLKNGLKWSRKLKLWCLQLKFLYDYFQRNKERKENRTRFILMDNRFRRSKILWGYTKISKVCY